MIPLEVAKAVISLLNSRAEPNLVASQSRPVGGGCIHSAHRLQLPEGQFFLKFNHQQELPNFLAEMKGLHLLRDANVLRVPQPIAAQKTSEHAFLLMEFIEQGPREKDFFRNFGAGLARLHQVSRKDFGLDTNNFIGRLPQFNSPKPTWAAFFQEQRLDPQLKLAEKTGLAPAGLRKKFEKLYQKLPDLIPEEPPALLHGDLWSGNFMVGPEGKAVIVDPAVYFGHREAEIAFTQLFGGFEPEFYQSYHQHNPLKKGWQERVDLFNLYPLTVHLNLFGRSYLPQIQSILARFV